VKNIPLLFIAALCASGCFAQDTVGRRNWLTDSVIEHYYVLKSNADVRQGPYKAFFRRKTLIAYGNYRNGVKKGLWQFFDMKGRMAERFNYDKNKFTYEAPLYVVDYLDYLFDDSTKIGDKLTRPLKIGGIYYGFLPYVSVFQMPFDTRDIDTFDFIAYIELLISPLGRLADYNVRVVSVAYKYDYTFNLDINLFDEADKTFRPATLNGRPVMSRIIIRCSVNPDGKLDFY
jgi:hypothetical protein